MKDPRFSKGKIDLNSKMTNLSTQTQQTMTVHSTGHLDKYSVLYISPILLIKMFYQVRMYTRIIANGEIRCE